MRERGLVGIARSVFLFVLVQLTAGCSSSPTIKQRAYIDSDILSNAFLPEEKSANLLNTVAREIVSPHYVLTVTPNLPAVAAVRTARQGFRLKWSDDKLKDEIVGAIAWSKVVPCFEVDLYSRDPDSANLNYFYFTLIDSANATYPLQPVEKNKEPKEDVNVDSYTTGGYGYYIGRTYHYTPSSTQVYSYKTYSSKNNYCLYKTIDLSKGFSVIVEPRFKAGVPLEDLVWSVDIKDQKTYRYGNGVPYGAMDAEAISNWLTERRENLKKIITSAASTY